MSDANASYEVCIMVGDRWEIHARHPVTGANAAIEEAKQLSQSSKALVKVVREVYDDETGLYKQVVVFKSAGLAAAASEKSAQSSPSGRGGGGGGGGGYQDSRSGGRGGGDLYASYDDDDDDDDDLYDGAAGRRGRASRGRSRVPTTVTVSGLFLRIFIYVLLALGLAALVTGLLPVFAPKFAARNIAVMGAGQANALFVVFITTFLLSFGLLALFFLNGIKVVAAPRRPRVQARAAPARPARVRRKLPQPSADILKTLKESEEKPPPDSDAAEDEQEAESESAPEPEEENILEAEPEPEPETPLSEAGETQKAKLTTFVATAAEEIRAAGAVDAFSRFGINLYVAGAVDSMATTQGLEASDSLQILAGAVQSLGTPADMARKFADGAADYLMQPKYVEMYESGRQSMMAFLEGDEEGARQITPALENWRNPAKKEEHSGPLAVLFTDIVGSTSMTVSVGDDAAQYVVRTHNRIVRSALTNFSGREVKHTGDGIMASFTTVSNAVEAAIEMQERVIANNAAEGDIPLHLCIGINAGEPVVEDDDLFGVTVQLSARLCAVAESDEIIVSEVVKGLCTGRAINFVSRGTREMKGFADPVPVYEVIWKEGNGA
ncbi:MAG: adenylate/guanylate cyclase domain-containing protein [Rhodospirillales bacterium]|nr:adenylate/guanylate cyclase domain-containing protein [Rhodospirillales bacterium]